jgi:nucleotide-binding universal stress UspA family protein
MALADERATSSTARKGRDESALRRLLVGVDGSDAAGAAASFAIWLAGTAGAEVTLVHVCRDLRLAEHAPHTADPAALRAAATHRLEETTEWQRRLQNLEDYAAEDAHVRSWVVRGRPAAALLDAATELDSDVILVGSTGVGSLRGRLLGSVSSQVVDHARCSVMVFREGQRSSPAHVASVVVGVDGSPGAAPAIAAATRLAVGLDAKLVLVSAYESTTALAPPTTELRAALRREAAEVLAAAREDVGDDAEIVEELCEGEARQALVDACERHGPSLLVVGTRGLGGFAGLLLGSTSRWVLNHAPCPVLVARDRKDGRS